MASIRGGASFNETLLLDELQGCDLIFPPSEKDFFRKNENLLTQFQILESSTLSKKQWRVEEYLKDKTVKKEGQTARLLSYIHIAL